MKQVTDLHGVRGQYVLVRASLNIPLKDGAVRNAFRLRRALPTLRYLHEQGAKVIVLSHIGREPEETLRPVFDALERHLPVQWGGQHTSEEFHKRRELMQDGDILMAENLRQFPGETENDPTFVAELAALGNVYVNDAFAEAHRAHASTYGLAKTLPAYAGLTFVEEMRELTKATSPAAPALFLLGGAKFETKAPLIEKFLDTYDHLFIGGALMNDILKGLGYEVGQSLVSDVSLKGKPFLKSKKLILPVDVVVDGPDGRKSKPIDAVSPEETIYDCGPMTIDMIATYVEKAATILWNGPFGAYEMGYTQSTEITARHVAASDAFSVLGGGDTVAAIETLELNDMYSFVSIGGGSMLTFLEQGTTEVIEVLEQADS
jgi:phosphoglycerate kinase